MARSFNPSSAGYLVANTPVVTGYPVTMCCLFNASSFPNDKTLISIADSAHGTNRLALTLRGSADANRPILATVANEEELAQAETTGGYLANTWYFAAAVFVSDTERRAYGIGSPGTDTTELTFPPDLNRTVIGARGNSFVNQIMEGSIAEVGIWNVALTEEEILLLSGGIPPFIVRPESLIHYWPLAGLDSPEVDRQGDLAMTLSGSVGVADHPYVKYPPPKRLLYGASVESFASVVPEKFLIVDQGRIKQALQRYLILADGVPEPEPVTGFAIMYIDQITGELSVKDSDGNLLTLSGGGGVHDHDGDYADLVHTHAHNDLTGLTTGDPHTQYLSLAGRSGGQTGAGGTASGDELSLQSTTHATKGALKLQPSGGFVQVGNGTPDRPFHVFGSGGQIAAFERTGATAAGSFKFFMATNVGGTGLTGGGAQVSLPLILLSDSSSISFIVDGTVETIRLVSGDVGIGRTAPQGKLHGYDGTMGWIFVSKTGVGGTLVPVLPDAAGDVTGVLVANYVTKASGGGVSGGQITLSLGNSGNVYNAGGETCQLLVNANGSVGLQRTAGTGTFTVGLQMIWI